jgi:class 3 adenylate cyclase
VRSPEDSRFGPPNAYTPRHLAERMLSVREALEGERKQVTVLFADLKSSRCSPRAIRGRRARS